MRRPGQPAMASCGLSEVPPPSPAALPIVHEPLHAHVHIHDHVITSAQISPRAIPRHECRGELLGDGAGLIAASPGAAPQRRCRGRRARDYIRRGISRQRVRPGDDVYRLLRPLRARPATTHAPRKHHDPRATRHAPRTTTEARSRQERRSNPTRSLHATVHLTLLPQTRAACDAAFLLYPCYKGEVGFTAPYAVTSTPSRYYSRSTEYSIDGFATCKAGGRPETSWGLRRNVKAHEAIRSKSLGLFVLTRSCLSSEGFEVVYRNLQGPSASAPHESVIVGTVPLSKATLPDGQNPKPPAG